jgi:hypothetical protein
MAASTPSLRDNLAFLPNIDVNEATQPRRNSHNRLADNNRPMVYSLRRLQTGYQGSHARQ